MRCLVLSDVHGNAAALDRLISLCEHDTHLAFDAACVLGDLSGYYYDPIAAWEVALRLDPNLHLGNHDIYLRDRLVNNHFGVTTAENESVAWTIMLHTEMMRAHQKQNVGEHAAIDAANTVAKITDHVKRTDVISPQVRTVDGYTLITVHGAPFREPFHGDDSYAMTYLYGRIGPYHNLMQTALEKAIKLAGSSAKRVILCTGHTHMPLIASLTHNGILRWHEGDWTDEKRDAQINLNDLFEEARAVAINPGAVGYPRVARALAHHAHAALIDTGAHSLRMIAIDLKDIMESVKAAMDGWDASPYFDDIRPDLERYYTARNMPLQYATLRHWETQIRQGLIDTFLNACADDDDNLYDYVRHAADGRDGFYLRNGY